jgi:aspartate/methionine/tyrosine aminotransferase
VKARSQLRSAYMEFAKLRSSARFNLANSGMESFPIADLPYRPEDLELTGTGSYGFPALLERLARHCGVPQECVVHAMGTSLANHLALAGTTDAGDGIVVEDPGYELIATTAEFLGLEVRTFPRRFENAYHIDPADVLAALTPRTRLIVMCNMHNPSSALEDEASLRALIAIAQERGVRLLVDEVYLEAAFELAPRSAFHLAPETVVITNSLTKAYGLSGLRCGWILAEPRLAEQIWRINDFFAATAPHPAEILSIVALDNLELPAQRARKLLQRNRALLEQFLKSRDDLQTISAPYGTIAFPRLCNGSVDKLFELLMQKYETSVVPGSFFGAPQHFRIGIAGNTPMVEEGLHRLGAALDELRK